VDIHVVCGGGTYIRSIARECGEALAVPPEHVDSTCELRNLSGEFCVGGTLTALERTRSGAFTIDESLDFDEIQDKVEVRCTAHEWRGCVALTYPYCPIT
jgi:tRNA pseudouridine55 synthase